ncbi:methyltransferase domain-containing protein [Acetobacter conturbans]|uniref:Methyltransferase domain-containing protein n=1 Tax=Acetobacter conturbans TaxID=1737472 RepID=A0ABX0JXG3_9PROT|nr:methyltransferase domain-containing protein [Acetobacter conturbans]NHN87160.1 methyltransferase domain-containing protein [Acetobacter conturbans]
MQDEVRSADVFYEAPTGAGTVRLLARRLTTSWPDLTGQTLLGLGYTTPFLPLWERQTAFAVAARLDPPPAHPNSRSPIPECLVDGAKLPFPDLCFDRILMVHALETTQASRDLLRAVWKVLRDDGKLILIVPNRRGIWAHSDTTPFGQGTPFSQRQLREHLRQSMFHVETCETALYPPPFSPLHRASRVSDVIERAGRAVLPACGGVVVAEAVKDMWGGLPLPASKSRFRLRRKVMEAV